MVRTRLALPIRVSMAVMVALGTCGCQSVLPGSQGLSQAIRRSDTNETFRKKVEADRFPTARQAGL